MHTSGAEVSGFIGILIVQVTILIIYGVFVRYDYEMLPTDAKNDNSTSEQLASVERQHRVSYPRKYFFTLSIYYSRTQRIKSMNSNKTDENCKSQKLKYENLNFTLC